MAKIILKSTRFLIFSCLASLSSLNLSADIGNSSDNPKYKTTSYRTVAQAKVTRQNRRANSKNKTPKVTRKNKQANSKNKTPTVAQAKVTRKNRQANSKNKSQTACKHGQCKSCYDTVYKPLWCDESVNKPNPDHHVPESMGPHGYNYDGLPWYLDDGYSHYNSFW